MAATVGEIIGYLKLDDSDWREKIERVKAEADSLNASRPTLKVTAETGDAQAKIDAVTKAEERLKVAESASERATALATIAQIRLNEMREKGAAQDARLATAEEAVRYAIERSESAAVRATAAEDALTAARRKEAEATVVESAATDKAAASTSKAGKSAQQAGGLYAMLVPAIALLGPALVPVAATAVGVTAALGGMGAAGVLAVYGIKRAMADGTAEGKAYQGLITSLKADATQLEDTAAAGLLPGSMQAVAEISAAMPTLNREIGTFAGQLGQILPTGVDAVVTMLTRAEPLLNAGGQSAVRFVDGLDRFAHSQGFQSFVDYAIQNLPTVEELLDTALKTTGDFLGAMAPYSHDIAVLVTGVLRLVDALTPVAPLIWGVWSAFQAWNLLKMTGIIGQLQKVSAQAKVTAGDVAGAEAVGGGGAVAGSILFGAGAAGSVAGYFANDAVGNAVASTTSGSASKKAAAGNSARNAATTGGFGSLAGAGGMGGVGEAMGIGASKTSAPTVSASQLASIKQAKTEEEALSTSVARQVQALDQNIAAWDQAAVAMLNAGTDGQTMVGAQDALTTATSATTAALKTNKASLDARSSAGVADREAARTQAQAISNVAAAMVKQGSTTEDAKVFTLQHAQSMERQMIAAGASKSAVYALVGQLLGVSKIKPVSKVDVEKAQAEAKLADWKRHLQNASKTYTATLSVTEQIQDVTNHLPLSLQQLIAGHQAKGGTIQRAASGITAGFAGSVTGAGTSVDDLAGLYALSNGEEVVSNMGGQASKWRPALKAMNAGRSPTEVLGIAAKTAGGAHYGSGSRVQHITNRTVAPEIHIHNPVAVDPVQQTAEAAQIALAYAGLA